MIKRTKILKKRLNVQRKLNMPRGTTLKLLGYRETGTYVIYEVTDGFNVWGSTNLDSPYHQRWELGNPHFIVAEITERAELGDLNWSTVTDVEFDGLLWKIDATEPPTLVEPRFWRVRMKQTGEES